MSSGDTTDTERKRAKEKLWQAQSSSALTRHLQYCPGSAILLPEIAGERNKSFNYCENLADTNLILYCS